MGFRNRCQILGAQGVINLSVPLVGGRDKRMLAGEIEIDYSRFWQRDHWRTLTSCYNKSAFFFHYADGLEKLIMTRHRFLWELDMATLQWALQCLKWEGTLSIEPGRANSMENLPFPPDPTVRPSNRHQYAMPAYLQVFHRPFESNLSILDLLCNQGPGAKKILINLSAA